MRFAVVAPWKVDPRGPFAAAITLYSERITRGGPDSFALVSPGSALADEKSQADFLVRECSKLHSDHYALVCLDEEGRTESSGAFARRIDEASVRGARGLAFVLGGAYGLPSALAGLPKLEALSLSPLTFAHELALTILLEQIYRAQCIRQGHPYHHGARSGFAKSRRGIGTV